MTDQKRTNIRLLMLSGFLLAMISMIALVGRDYSDTTDLNRTAFTLENTIDVNRVITTTGGVELQLEFTGGKWILNKKYEADPTKIHLLFATMQQVRIRRPVTSEQRDSLRSMLSSGGSTLQFYADNELLLEFTTLGMEERNTTFFSDREGNIFLMEIPGYRAYIHPLVAIEESQWRNLNLYHRLNWSNLGSIHVTYPKQPNDDFSIVQGSGFFEVEGLQVTDTTRLIDYVDYVSLLNAERYVDAPDTSSLLESSIKIDVRDVGNRPYILELFLKETEEDEILGRMDSSVYFAIPADRIEPLLKSRDYFGN